MSFSNKLNNSIKSQRHKAFTLAEVLITLGLIGNVALLVLPGLIVNVEKQVAVTKVKAIYSLLTQATSSIAADCGYDGNLISCLSVDGSNDNNAPSRAEISSLYISKMKIGKDCRDGSHECFSTDNYKFLNNNNWGYIDNTADNSFCGDDRIILTNGTALCFDWNGKSYPDSYWNIFVDINGTKKPNTLGKDTFSFSYSATKKALILPVGADDCKTSSAGYTCSNKVIREGEITYY